MAKETLKKIWGMVLDFVWSEGIARGEWFLLWDRFWFLISFFLADWTVCIKSTMMPYGVEGEGVARSQSWETRAVKWDRTRHAEDGLRLLAIEVRADGNAFSRRL
jgi:hypothetical protein